MNTSMKILRSLAIAILWLGSTLAERELSFLRNHRDVLEEHSLQHDGLTRWFLEHAPQDGLSDNSPLVILLHGGGGSMRQVFRHRQKGKLRRWLELSNDNGFLLLAPNGIRNRRASNRKNTKGNTQNWNDLRDTKLPESQEDDVGFIAAVVEWAISNRQVDPSRVYVTGVSNGGMMTQRLLIERPDLFAAGASFIGNLPAEDIASPSPTPPIFLMNGTSDPIMPWEGGKVGPSDSRVRSSLATRDYFLGVNQVDPDPLKIGLRDMDPADGCLINSEFYDSAVGGAVQFYTMVGGGHQIPTSEFEKRDGFLRRFFVNRQKRGAKCRDANGVDLAWEFMAKFSK